MIGTVGGVFPCDDGREHTCGFRQDPGGWAGAGSPSGVARGAIIGAWAVTRFVWLETQSARSAPGPLVVHDNGGRPKSHGGGKKLDVVDVHNVRLKTCFNLCMILSMIGSDSPSDNERLGMLLTIRTTPGSSLIVLPSSHSTGCRQPARCDPDRNAAARAAVCLLCRRSGEAMGHQHHGKRFTHRSHDGSCHRYIPRVHMSSTSKTLKSVLIVDDEENLRHVLRLMLEQLGSM